jgi:hypothetical protein
MNYIMTGSNYPDFLGMNNRQYFNLVQDLGLSQTTLNYITSSWIYSGSNFYKQCSSCNCLFTIGSRSDDCPECRTNKRRVYMKRLMQRRRTGEGLT